MEKQKNDGRAKGMKAELGTCRGDHTDLNGSCFEELMKKQDQKDKMWFYKGSPNALFLYVPGFNIKAKKKSVCGMQSLSHY